MTQQTRAPINWDKVILLAVLTMGLIIAIGEVLSKWFDVPKVGLLITGLMVSLCAYLALSMILKYRGTGFERGDMIILFVVVLLTLASIILLPRVFPHVFTQVNLDFMSLIR